MVRRPPDAVQTEPRQRPAHVKEAIIVERAFKHLRLEAEAVAEFAFSWNARFRRSAEPQTRLFWG